MQGKLGFKFHYLPSTNYIQRGGLCGKRGEKSPLTSKKRRQALA